MLPVTNPYSMSDSLSVTTFPSQHRTSRKAIGQVYVISTTTRPEQYDMDYRIDVPDLEDRRERARLLKQYNRDEAERLEVERVREEEQLTETEEREAADLEMAQWFQTMRVG